MSSTDVTELATDYLVVGAGAVAMAFVDTLIEDPDSEVVLVDRRAAPGGHWQDAYPFVQLHQPSANYGVNSTPLGHDRIDDEGPNRGFHELAGAAELCDYFDGVMRHRFLPSGRVHFFPMSEYLGGTRFRSNLTGQVTDVAVRRCIVDATYLASAIPATDPPPFSVADDVRCIPVGELVEISRPPERVVIIGGGKTATDACSWLLGQGTPADSITWIRPRDAWFMNRANFQPGAGAVETFAGIVHELEALTGTESVDDAFVHLEEAGLMMRLDPTVRPTMARGATLTTVEMSDLRTIDHVVRLGHVRRIERDEIVLDDGSIPTSAVHLHVHCAARGLPRTPPRPIFSHGSITLQNITRMHPTLSAAMAGHVETTGRSTQEKNQVLPPNPYSSTPFDFLRMILMGLRTEFGWGTAPDLQAWLDGSRLNVMKGVDAHADPDRLRDLQGRFFAAIGPAQAKLDKLLDSASPTERELVFDPS